MAVRITSFICAYLFALSSLFGNEGSKWISADLEELELSAQEGDSYAQAFLALCYIHGDKGLNISFDKASYWANLSTETDHWLGWFVMGYLHRFSPLGPNVEKVGQFYKKVFKNPDGTLVKNVSTGDPLASYVMAEIFTAEEVEPEINSDLQFAAKHYANASNLGYGPASVQHALLKLHANSIEGQNVEISKDLSGGVFILKEVAEKQLPSGNHFLGRCYFKGIGVIEDYKMALVHFQAAADRGYTTSQLIVAHFYAYGLTGPAKLDLALRYANLALLQDKEKATEKIIEYEQLMENQLKGISQRITQKSYDSVPSPTSPALNEAPPLPPEPIGLPKPPRFNSVPDRLPSIYDKQEPRNANFLPESSLIEKPSDDGLQDLSLAKEHYFGRGSNLDLERAFQLFSQSASLGNPEAARYLGIMYLRGKGVTKDTQKALEWFTRAADGGDELAKKNVKTLQILGSRK
jgi:TPR repeat protein